MQTQLQTGLQDEQWKQVADGQVQESKTEFTQ